MAAEKESAEPGQTIEQLLKEFAAITDQAKRREFYLAHAELQAIYSNGNFH